MNYFASLGIFMRRSNKITAHVKKKKNNSLPGFCSIIFNASIAAEASMGGNDAEKQYPAPESLCKKDEFAKRTRVTLGLLSCAHDLPQEGGYCPFSYRKFINCPL